MSGANVSDPPALVPAPRRTPWWLGLAAFALWLVAWLLGRTLRLRVSGLERVERLRADGRPIVYCFWHGRQLALFRANPERGPGRALAVLSSWSRDGELQARVCRRFGLRVVRGSSSRGGLASLLALSRELRAGRVVGLAVDGPRGPAFEAKPGAAALARAAGAALVPVTTGARRRRELRRAWDRFQLPAPFTRVEVLFGEPLEVPRGAAGPGLEAVTARLGAALTALTAEADARARGRPLV